MCRLPARHRRQLLGERESSKCCGWHGANLCQVLGVDALTLPARPPIPTACCRYPSPYTSFCSSHRPVTGQGNAQRRNAKAEATGSPLHRPVVPPNMLFPVRPPTSACASQHITGSSSWGWGAGQQTFPRPTHLTAGGWVSLWFDTGPSPLSAGRCGWTPGLSRTLRAVVSGRNHKLGLWLRPAILPWCLHQSHCRPGLDRAAPQALKLNFTTQGSRRMRGVIARGCTNPSAIVLFF